MTEECIVTKIKGKTAYITLASKERCGGCKACALGRTNKASVPAAMEVECKQGDTVLAEIPQKDLSKSAVLIYLIPLLFLVIGFFAGGAIATSAGNKVDLIRIVTAFALMLISFIPCIFLDFFYRRKKEYIHTIKEVVKNNNSQDQT